MVFKWCESVISGPPIIKQQFLVFHQLLYVPQFDALNVRIEFQKWDYFTNSNSRLMTRKWFERCAMLLYQRFRESGASRQRQLFNFRTHCKKFKPGLFTQFPSNKSSTLLNKVFICSARASTNVTSSSFNMRSRGNFDWIYRSSCKCSFVKNSYSSMNWASSFIRKELSTHSE